MFGKKIALVAVATVAFAAIPVVSQAHVAYTGKTPASVKSVPMTLSASTTVKAATHKKHKLHTSKKHAAKLHTAKKHHKSLSHKKA